MWADSLPSELSGKPEIKQSSFYFTLCLSERQWCPWLQNQCFHTASRMSARAIESGEGHALGSLLLELLPEGECPWGSSRGWVAQSLGFLGGQRGSGFWPGGATWCSGSIKALSPGSQLVLCAGRTPSSPLVLGLPLSVVSLVHLQAPLTPLSSASSEVPSLHQRSWGLQERVEGAVWGLCSPSCPHHCVLPHYFFLPEEEESSQSSSQTSDGSSPGKAPEGPHQGPDGSGSDPRDPPKSEDSNFYHYAGNGSLTNPWILTPYPLLSSTC